MPCMFRTLFGAGCCGIGIRQVWFCNSVLWHWNASQIVLDNVERCSATMSTLPTWSADATMLTKSMFPLSFHSTFCGHDVLTVAYTPSGPQMG